MMSVYFCGTIKSDRATYVIVVHNVDRRKLLKDGYCMITLYGCHRRRSVEMLRDKYGV